MVVNCFRTIPLIRQQILCDFDPSRQQLFTTILWHIWPPKNADVLNGWSLWWLFPKITFQCLIFKIQPDNLKLIPYQLNYQKHFTYCQLSSNETLYHTCRVDDNWKYEDLICKSGITLYKEIWRVSLQKITPPNLDPHKLETPQPMLT